MNITRIDQIRAEGKQAARDGLPMSANPYPHHSTHAEHWDRGYLFQLLDEAKEAA